LIRKVGGEHICTGQYQPNRKDRTTHLVSVIHNATVVELLRKKKEVDRIAKVSPGLVENGATSPL